MHRSFLCAAALVATCALGACTGLTQGENGSGDDTYLDGGTPPIKPGEITYGTGSIAVDHRIETTFVLQTTADARDTSKPPVLTKKLFAVNPDSGNVRNMGDYSNRSDLRILFPKSGVLVMSEEYGQDRLELFDTGTLAPKLSATRSVRYHGTRMAPSREWFAVADNTSDHAPIHIIDSASLESVIIPHDGDWLEAMWMNQRDELVAIVFYDFPLGDAPYARILSWDADELRTCGFTNAACWQSKRLDITVPDVTGDLYFSYSWVGISPDDTKAVFPVRTKIAPSSYRHDLLVVDTDTGELAAVENAKGPVGFTPDSQTIVSYNGSSSDQQQLLLIDALTLEKDPEPVDIDGGLSFFVSHEGNFIVVASNYGDQKLVLYDVDQQKQTTMEGPAMGLFEFVSRLGHNELWLLDDQDLYRLDLDLGELELIPTTFSPQHINILRDRDLLVMDDNLGTQLSFFDPTTLQVGKQVHLP